MNPWQQRFQAPQYVYGETANAFIQQHYTSFPQQAKLAAFAEGEGRNAVFLATKGHTVTAFDYAQSGLDKTQMLASKNHVEVDTVLADLIEDDLPQQQFDGAFMVFGHFAQQQQEMVLQKIADAVKPGGIIMMELYSTEQLHYGTGGPPVKEMLYDAVALLQWCQQFKVLHFFTGEQTRHEGELHTGLAHTVQFIVQK